MLVSLEGLVCTVIDAVDTFETSLRAMATHPRRRKNAPVKRFIVEDRSMEPTLHPGQGLIAIRSRKLRRNQLRVVEHPERPGFWIVKRLGDRVDQTRWMLLADNSSEGQDSRHFGPVDMADSWRIVVKIPQRWM